MATAHTWNSRGTRLLYSGPTHPHFPKRDTWRQPPARKGPEGLRCLLGPRQIAPRVKDQGPLLLHTPQDTGGLTSTRGLSSPCAAVYTALDTGLYETPAFGGFVVAG